jgi:hypothetical protein
MDSNSQTLIVKKTSYTTSSDSENEINALKEEPDVHQRTRAQEPSAINRALT